MGVSKGTYECLDCGLGEIPGDRMYDKYICVFCHEDADFTQLQKRLRHVEHPFTRYIPEKVRQTVLEEAGRLCQYCFQEEATTVDHIVPFSYLPDHSPDNLLAACLPCNQYASDKMFESLSHKRRFIVDRRLKKARKTRLAIWTWEELQGVSYSLRGGKKIIVKDQAEGERLQASLKELGYSVVL